MNEQEIIELLDWMSTRFRGAGYCYEDCENNEKIVTSEEVLKIYKKEHGY